MTGNTLTSVANLTLDHDVAMKTYIDSDSAIDKVSKRGDTVTAELQISVSSDVSRLTGCTDLTEGKSSLLVLGNHENQLQLTMNSPVTTETSHGFLVRANEMAVLQLASSIMVNKNITMNDNHITKLPSWWRATVVERRSLTGELSLSCAQPAADG